MGIILSRWFRKQRLLAGLFLGLSLIGLVVGVSQEGSAQEPSDGFVISGRLIDSQEQPVAGAQISAHLQDEDGLSISQENQRFDDASQLGANWVSLPRAEVFNGG